MKAGITVIPIPGPSAVMAALSASGLPADAVRLPGLSAPQVGQRRTGWLESLAAETGTVVFFEAPHRISRDAGRHRGRYWLIDQYHVHRELTKIKRRIVLYTNIDMSDDPIEAIGEFVVVVGPIAVKPVRTERR